MIEQSDEFNEYALEGRRTFLDLGAGNARLRIYDGVRPAANGTPAGTLLGEIALDKPCGTVSAGQLVLTAADEPLALESGVATWARIVNGADTWAMDCDVSNVAGSGEVKLSDTAVLSGGLLTLISAVLN